MPLTKIQSLGITDGTIVNADINASAAIASTKLSGISSDYVKLLSTSLSGATSINVDGYFTSDYDRYVCFMSNVHYEGTNDGGLVNFRFRRSNADVTSSIYCSATVRAYNDSSTTGPYAWTNWNATSGYLSEGSSSLTYPGNIELRFHNPLETNASPTISSQISGWQGTGYIHGGAGTIVLRDSIGAISGFTIFGTANLTIKKLTLYGIKD
jgi:hypothetical protein